MKTISENGSVAEYQGKKLDTPITYNFDANQYENLTEAKESEDWLSDAEILRVINTKKKTAAKAAAYQEATAKLKADYENSTDFKRNNFVKAAMAAGFSQAEAEALAASKL